MHSGDMKSDTRNPMTLSPSPALPSPFETTHSPSLPPLSSPLTASLPPLPSSPPSHLENPLTITQGTKFRLSKVTRRGDGNTLITQPVADNTDIRVLSPSIVNRQVLSKTRPLSPVDPVDGRPYTGTLLAVQNENVQQGNKKHGWKESLGVRRKESVRKQKDSTQEEESCVSSDGKEPAKGKGRGRRRPRIFKLKFHHQALPPEYLDHYEASLRQEQQLPTTPVKAESPGIRETPKGPREVITNGLQSGIRQNKGRKNQKNSRPITIHEAGGGATEALLRDLLLANPQLHQAALHQAALARAQSVPSIMLASMHDPSPRLSYHHNPMPPPSPNGSFADEMSFCSSDMSIEECPQQRRGRKNSKKGSNGEHLMGRGLGGSGMGATRAGYEQDRPSSQMSTDVPLDSLAMQYAALERNALTRSRSFTTLIQAPPQDQNEPLNLCMRDESPEGVTSPMTPGTPLSCGEVEFSSQVKKEPTTVAEDDIKQLRYSLKHFNHCRSPMRADSRTPNSPPTDYYWANSGCIGTNPYWMHDYRLKAEDGLSSGQSTPSLCSQSSHLPCMSPPVWPHVSPPPHMFPLTPSPVPPLSPLPPPHPRNLQGIPQHRLDDSTRESLYPVGLRRERCTSTPPQSKISPAKGGARRKRSALFIPPADPNNGVSICKFKFTGGPNPSLEEKKMVSVDSSGTLRYFSGGEKVSYSPSAHGKPPIGNTRITGKILENLSKCEKDVKKIRLESDNDDTCSLPGCMVDPSCSSAATGTTESCEYGIQSQNNSLQIEDSPKRKRRSKKSTVREKLEQTLREKGLLIQTQQVESAEGATYCKFRQLRKITRYLFRSWKDYLPGQMPPDGIPRDPDSPDMRPPAPYEHSHNMPRSPQLVAQAYAGMAAARQ